mmetsp:Transcript_25828/g.43013  ORF Transcript_25828/g.43013 Transcript_25828/m.43013 type:complete len:243 (-) Transcript_25828:172-900(-)
MFLWVEYGEEVCTSRLLLNSDVTCNIFLDALRRSAAKGGAEAHGAAEAEARGQLAQLGADLAAARQLLEEMAADEGETGGEKNGMVAEAETVVRKISAKKTYVEQKLKTLAEGIELMSALSSPDTIIDLAGPDGKILRLYENLTTRALEFTQPKGVYTLVKVVPPEEAAEGGGGGGKGGKGAAAAEPAVVPLRFALPPEPPEEDEDAERPGTAASRGGGTPPPPSAKGGKGGKPAAGKGKKK